MSSFFQKTNFWRRIAAVWIDALVVYIGVNLQILFGEWVGVRASFEPLFISLFGIYSTIALLTYDQTIGKALAGLQIISNARTLLSHKTIFIREIIGKWSIIALLLGIGRLIIGPYWVPTVYDLSVALFIFFLYCLYFLKTGRTFWDSIASTTVVRQSPYATRKANIALFILFTAFVIEIGTKVNSFLEKGWLPCNLSLYRSNRLLNPYTEFLQRQNTAPINYIVQLYEQYDVVVLCERMHPEATQWTFISDLISDSRFINRVGHVFTEYGMANQQPYLDRFMATPDLSEEEIKERAIHIMRNLTPTWPTWTNTNFFDYLQRLYRLNQSLPESKQVHHYLSDVALSWEAQTKEGYHSFRRSQKGLRMRDRIMADRIIRKFRAIESSQEPRKKCLVIMNYGHAFGSIQNSDQQLKKRVYEFLANAFPERTANVLLNTEVPFLFSLIQGGAWDAAFKALGNRPVGFNFANSPFGDDHFDLLPDQLWIKETYRYKDVFTGFIFTHPIDKQYMEKGIPGYFTNFEVEALRRAQLHSKYQLELVQKAIKMTKIVRSPVKQEMLSLTIQTKMTLTIFAVFGMAFFTGFGIWFAQSRKRSGLPL